MKAMLRETKENVQGTNSDSKETGTQINGVDQKEERNIQPEKNEETRIQKNEERLRNLQDILKRSNIWIIGVPEGEEEEQKIENLFEQIMENFPDLAKEIDFRELIFCHIVKYMYLFLLRNNCVCVSHLFCDSV